MEKRCHIPGREACPFLPPAKAALRPRDISDIRKQGGHESYIAALTCAQSLWLQGLPAQAILQLNHAMSHVLDESDPQWPMPYQALVWVLSRRHEHGFLGNPVRHFQHLASRMSGPKQTIRSCRAWICFHLSERLLPEKEFPRDNRQIKQDQLIIPTWNDCLSQLKGLGTQTEHALLTRLSDTPT